MIDADRRSPSVNRNWLIFLGLLMVPLFFPRLRPPEGRVWEAGWDALHFPGFILITWALAALLGPWIPSPRARIAAAAGLAVLAAGLSELAHDALGRSSSWKDFGVDLLGVTCGVVGWFVPRKGPRRSQLAFMGLVAAILACLLLPALLGHRAVRQVRSYFPDLGCFHHPGSRRLWVAQGNASLAWEAARGALRVRIGPGTFGGVSCRPASGDWSGRGSLHLGIENPGEPFSLGIRIDDARSSSSEHGSRYNGEREIPSGRTDLRVPLAEVAAAPAGRRLELDRVRRLVLFTGHQAGGREFVINSAFLD